MTNKLKQSLLVIVLLTLGGCDQSPPSANTNSDQYKLGYAAGEEAGKAELCANIESFSSNIIEALHNDGICS